VHAVALIESAINNEGSSRPGKLKFQLWYMVYDTSHRFKV